MGDYVRFFAAVTVVLVLWHFIVQVWQPAAAFVRI